MFSPIYRLDPNRDLTFERIIEGVTPEQIWQAWTQPELIKQWFTPSPWVTTACEIDLCAGGLFSTTMRSPEGQEFPNEGCYLEVIENKKLVWTNALLPGYRPALADPDGFHFTAMIALEPHAKGTKYCATVIHGDQESCQKHNSMGFHEGWGAALDQLVALVKAQ